MEFEIPESLANVLLGMIQSDSQLARRLNEHGVCHGKRVVPSRLFDATSLNALYGLCKAADERELMFQMLALDNIYSAPDARKIPGLELLVPGLVAYLSRDAIDGWLYRRGKDGVLLPWLVHSMRHVVPADGSPYVVIGLLANTMQSASREAAADPRLRRSGMTTAIMVDADDIAGRSIPELLAEHGFYKECEDFKREYEAHAQRFRELQSRFGTQLVASHSAWIAAGGPASNPRLECLPIKAGTTARCVNDEALLERRFEASTEAGFWRDSGVSEGFDRVPLHCYLYLFHLDLHRNLWVHVQHLQDYRYQPALRDKLVLPQAHRDLIDILTAERNFLMEDIVQGKSGGTTILCKGAPGLGKTLTAEVYAEVVAKPLYRVHSGQLGVTAESVEANLSKILQRAARWDSVLLLDEADVYIRRRDNDLQHNAIVAEFLRTLEYFNGLLFMTTNRIADIDDAILSRCIAIIQYDTPTREDAVRLWKTLAAQFQAELPDALVERLAQTYATASGRDIKELLKLTSKFCRSKQLPFSEDAFAQCAAFRSIGQQA
ncbi:MAG: AAA family ATPase [Comamonadaceae bacterium]|nr:MAG: AAA family ATPase [Comamonadaceae bacterium]